MSNEKNRKSPTASYLKAMSTLFFASKEERGLGWHAALKRYVEEFLDEKEGRRDHEQIPLPKPKHAYVQLPRRDTDFFQRVNGYLKSVDPDIGINSRFGQLTWRKLAHNFWGTWGVKTEVGRDDPVLLAHRHAFLRDYRDYRSAKGQSTRFALVVPEPIFQRLQQNGFDAATLAKQNDCFTLDVFLHCDIGLHWLSQEWRIYYVEPQQPLQPQHKAESVVSSIQKTQDDDAYLRAAAKLHKTLGPKNCEKMKAALTQALEDGGFDGLLQPPSAKTGQYRYNGRRMELHEKLIKYGITDSPSSGWKLISAFVRCRAYNAL